MDHWLLYLAGKPYTLRASIGALHAIERRTGKPLKGLITALDAGAAATDVIRVIAEEGLHADGQALPDTAPDKAWQGVASQLARFLLTGMGYAGTETLADIMPTLRTPDWDDMLKTFCGVMGRPLTEFWQVTLVEYALIVEGFCLLHEIEMGAATAPATSHDLAELLKQFPDAVAGEGICR